MIWRSNWPTRHWRATLLIASLIGALMLISALQLTPNVSLGAMLAQQTPSAAAMQTIASQYRAMDELHIVASIPEAHLPAGERHKQLTAFAHRLASQLIQLEQVANVQFQVNEDAPEQQFVEEVITPNLLLYLDEASFAEALSRLTPETMRQQLSQNETMIAAPGPAAGAIARQLLRDPLRLREMIPSIDALALGPEGYFISPDGSSLLIRIRGTQPASDLAFTSTLLNTTQQVANNVNEDGLLLEYAGAYAIANTSHQAIRRDMIRSVIGSLVLIQLFLLVVYRRLVSFVLAVAPVALAIVTAFGIFALVFDHVTPVTAVLGAVLAGLGIDYCVHVLSHYEQHRSAGACAMDAATQAIADVGPRTAAAAATTLIGFLAIAMSQVAALREFAILGALGLAVALGTSLTVLPALLIGTDRRCRAGDSRRDSVIAGLMAGIMSYRTTLIAVCSVVLLLAVALLAITPRDAVRFEPDLTTMHPQPNPALDLQQRINREFTGGADTLLLHLHAASPQQLQALAHDVHRRLNVPTVRDSGVSSIFSPATLVPDPATAAQRMSVLEGIDPEKVASDFQAALDESIFDGAMYVQYSNFLRELVRPTVPTLDDVRQYPPLADALLAQPSNAGSGVTHHALGIVTLDRSLSDRAKRRETITAIRRALIDLPDGQVTLTGMSVIGHDTERAIGHDAAVLLLAAAAAVLAFLLLLFRRLLDVVFTLLPTLFGLACLLAAMKLMPSQQGFNMINLIALPLLCGIGVDDGIFMMSIARRHRDASVSQLTRQMLASSHAVIVTSVTTLLAFGSLMLTSVPAIQSLGWMTAVGVGACLVGTLGLLVPLLLWRNARAAGS